MTKSPLFCLLFLSASFALPFASAADTTITNTNAPVIPPAATNIIEFSRDIRPILETSCLNCHGRGRDKGGFQLDTRETTLKGGDSGPALQLGKSQDSLLIRLVSGLDPDNFMPQKGKPLTQRQIGLLRAWIDQGLPWDQGTTFARHEPANLKPRRPHLPPAKPGLENPVDRLLSVYFASNNIHFNPSALVDDRLFARRAYLDVIGLLPTPDELKEFTADPAQKRRENLVRKLLEDNQRYAAHWLAFWNDLLRNDYKGTGYIDNGRKQISQWLYSALLTNMPYDRFVAQLVNPVPGSEGFANGIVWRGVVNASQNPAMQTAQNVSQVFMGVNIKCASCHDSFINEWKLSDAYGLAAVYHDGPLEMFECDKPTARQAQPAFIYPELGSFEDNMDRQARLARLQHLLCGPENGRLTRTIVNRLWARFFGHGLVEPIDDMEQKAWNQDLLDWLAEDLAEHHYDLKRTMALLLTSKAYQLPAVPEAEFPHGAYVFRGPTVRRLSAEQFRDAVAQITGVWMPKSDFPGVTNHIRASFAASDPLMTALGRPNREQVVTRRSSEATTLQALELTNGDRLAAILQKGAAHLAGTNTPPTDLVDRIFTLGLSRHPSAAEKQLAQTILTQHSAKQGIEDLLWSLTMLPEFQLIY